MSQGGKSAFSAISEISALWCGQAGACGSSIWGFGGSAAPTPAIVALRNLISWQLRCSDVLTLELWYFGSPCSDLALYHIGAPESPMLRRANSGVPAPALAPWSQKALLLGSDVLAAPVL